MSRAISMSDRPSANGDSGCSNLKPGENGSTGTDDGRSRVCDVHRNRRVAQPKLSSHGHHRLNIALFTINTHHPDISSI
jgi:hypothetical protein